MGYNNEKGGFIAHKSRSNLEDKMADEDKSIFDNLIDAVTNRDEKAAAEKAAAEKAAARKAAAAKLAAERAAVRKAAAAKLAAEKAAARKAAADKLAAEKAAARKAAADKLAAEKAAARKATADKLAAERAAARMAAAQKAAAEREAARLAAAAPKKGTVQVRSLHIRADHSAEAQGVGGLVSGNEVTILETWTDGKNTWAKIGPDQWAAMIYNGETYIKVE